MIGTYFYEYCADRHHENHVVNLSIDAMYMHNARLLRNVILKRLAKMQVLMLIMMVKMLHNSLQLAHIT